MFDVIQGDLEVLEEELLTAVVSSVDLVTEVGTHLIQSGGKRLRPALCLLAAHGSRTFDLQRVLPLATAFELIHMASLVHDDVIDDSDTRRGAPTANAKWGNQVAILSGDYIFARAYKLIAVAGYGDHVSERLSDLICNLSLGEIVQDQAMFQASQGMDDYFGRIQKKTADFLEICCELGAEVGGLSRKAQEQLAGYGHCIGMAFQITDDLLDIQQTSEQLGKPAGNDIRQGIVTLPVIRALEVSRDAEELKKIVTNPEMSDADVERALAIVNDTDGEELAKAKADEYLARAKALIPAGLPQEIGEAYVQIADFIGERDF